ncbi:MAG: glycosyltransferase [Alphaproteobacteria bacterium]|nr:glycosyltransferase [Alphaproteobacteria bacterium]
MPRISVIMPVFNAAGFLKETIASVQAQSLDDWKLLAVEDGSTIWRNTATAAAQT